MADRLSPGLRASARVLQLVLLFVLGLALRAGSARAETAESLPGGATSLKESHDDWTVACELQTQADKTVKVCTLTQEQIDNRSRQRVLAIELKPETTGVAGTLILPFGLALEQGVTFQIDDGPVGTAQRFRTCLPVGCIVPISFDARTLAMLRKASTLKIKTIADGAKEMPFLISLKGFPGAFDRTIALLK
jgi:invasion protein IalB